MGKRRQPAERVSIMLVHYDLDTVAWEGSSAEPQTRDKASYWSFPARLSVVCVLVNSWEDLSLHASSFSLDLSPTNEAIPAALISSTATKDVLEVTYNQ